MFFTLSTLSPNVSMFSTAIDTIGESYRETLPESYFRGNLSEKDARVIDIVDAINTIKSCGEIDSYRL